MTSFPWEALATLCTGLAAVVAATIVGLKQTKIAQNQAKIEESKLRFDLFDRRMRIADIHSKLISAAINEEQRLSFVQAFMEKRSEIKFLFDEPIAALLDQAYEISVDLDHSRRSGTAEELHSAREAASQNAKAFQDAAYHYLALGRKA